MGTYLHGIFDSQEFTQKLIRIILKDKGCEECELRAPDMAQYKEEQYDKLAALVRENVDVKAVYSYMGLEDRG